MRGDFEGLRKFGVRSRERTAHLAGRGSRHNAKDASAHYGKERVLALELGRVL